MTLSSPTRLPPPVSYSFYIFEHSTWWGYRALWRERGKHDLFWLWVAGKQPRPLGDEEAAGP